MLAQTFVLNKYRLRTFSLVDQVERRFAVNPVFQFIMSYGGLRGAVAYGLVSSINDEYVSAEEKRLYLTACEAVVIFTVFLQVCS